MTDTPIIGQIYPKVEAPVVFKVDLMFVNNQGQFLVMQFNCPPGVYPNKDWALDLIKQAQQDGLRALKQETKDLTWRLPTATEFVTVTSGGKLKPFGSKWQEPFTSKLESNNGNIQLENLGGDERQA